MTKLRIIVGAITIAALSGLTYGGYYIKGIKAENNQLQEALGSTNDSLTQVKLQRDALYDQLDAERKKNGDYSSQLDQATTKVEALQRLAETDPELLQKYSRVYFLNENYKPSALTAIDTKYLFDKTKTLEVHDRVWPFLKNMLDAAASAGVEIDVASAYRSFGTQAALKSSYKVTYGAGTSNQFSADQGYSEHQLGTALDFTTKAVGGALTGFQKDPAYNWLMANAYKYGFILSYPENNSYYIFEPWHWRFVGLDFALLLHNENKHFYDLDQREINPFLGNIFNSVVSTPTTNH